MIKSLDRGAAAAGNGLLGFGYENLLRNIDAAADNVTTAISAIADGLSAGAVYLTVTGTSGESGDDGQVGRGNRVNGLITPCRPMSLEAAASKNPVTHVGKLYNVTAQKIAERLVAEVHASEGHGYQTHINRALREYVPQIAGAECFMVSRIGTPVTSPALLQVKLATRDGIPATQFKRRAEEIAVDCLSHIPKLIDDFIAGTVEVF